MSENVSEISPLLEPLSALQRLLDQYSGQSVIIGGIAVSLIGKPRLTADIDALILIEIDEIAIFIKKAENEGIFPRISDAESFAKKKRMILLTHEVSNTNIDISLGLLPFEQEMVARSSRHNIKEISLQLPSPEDLIISKAVAHRAIDLLDIRGIIQSQKDLDKERIEDWVKQFAELLEKPELWEDIAQML